MKIGILACSVFEPELEKVLSDIENKKLFEDNIKVTYLHFGLHTNLDKLEKDVTDSLDKLTLKYDKVIVLYGSKCHYRFFEFLKKYDNIVTIKPANCLEAIIGDKVVESYVEGKDIYLTSGWVEKFDELNKFSNAVDNYDRLNQFGMYENAIIGDTGVIEITDDMIFELYEKIQVPVEVECTVFSKVKVCEEVTREVLQDAYSPQKIIKFEHRLINLNKTLMANSDTFLVRENITYDNEDIQIKDIVNACCNASIENTYIEGSNCVIQGIIKVDILFIPIEGLKMIYKISEEIPFEHELEINKLTDTCSVFNTICIEKIDIDLSKNQIDLNIKINRFVEAIDKKPESFIIKGEDKGDYDLSTAPSIIIYICKEDDNLWDIAKKYNTTEEEIAQTNEISMDEELQPGKCLILEKKVAQDE